MLGFAVEKVAFSKSGRLLFVRYAEGRCLVYDVTATQADEATNTPINETIVGNLNHGSSKVVDVAVHNEGVCVAVGEERGQDTVARIFWPRRSN